MTDNDFNPVVEIQAEVQVTPTLELQAEVDMGSLASERNAEAWAVGQRGGVDVSSTDQTYHNNAKYWAEQAEQTVVGSIIDDTSTALNKTWSAHKVSEEFAETNGEVTNLKSAKAPIITESISTPADVQTFSDGADGMPVKTLTVGIDPVQDLHGYDSPWPAGGGKNLINISGTKTITSQTVVGSVTLNAGTYSFSCKIKDNSNIAGSIKINAGATNLKSSPFDAGLNGIAKAENVTIGTDDTSVNFIISGSVAGYNYTASEFQCEIGSTATDYAPYENICPITGHTGANVSRTGINVWDEQWELGSVSDRNGQYEENNTRICSKNYIPVVGGQSYYFQNGSNKEMGLLIYDHDKNYLGAWKSTGWKIAEGSNNVTGQAIQLPDNVGFIKIRVVSSYGTTYNNDISINYPSTDTQYHPGHVQQIEYEFPQEAGTVYGGTLTIHQDGSGELVVDKQYLSFSSVNGVSTHPSGKHYWPLNNPSSAPADSINTDNTNTELFTSNMFVCSSITVTEGNFYVTLNGGLVVAVPYAGQQAISTKQGADEWLTGNPIEVCIPLATPTTYNLTCPQVLSLLGTNNLWADTGKINAVEYPADTKLYIDKKLTELQALVLEN